MCRYPFLCFFFGILVLCASANTQQTSSTAHANPQAVAVLSQSLAAAGWAKNTRSPHDFKASGTITYFWPGEPVSGPVTVLARGSDQFRPDAQLHQGLRSVVVNRGNGKLSEVAGYHYELDFADYRTINGVSVPTLVSERHMGKTIWELRLAVVIFDVGLTSSEFSLE